jgi:hypothetical protein
MADSCIDRDQAIQIEECIRDVRAEINRLEGPIGGKELKPFGSGNDPRKKRFLNDELDYFIDLLLGDDDDDNCGGCTTGTMDKTTTTMMSEIESSSAATSDTPSASTGEMTESPSETTETSSISTIPMFLRKSNFINYSDQYTMINPMKCSFKSTDAEQAKCVKMNCEMSKNGNFDCVYNAIIDLCNASPSIFKCIQAKLDKICEGNDNRMCKKTYSATKNPGTINLGKLKYIYSICATSKKNTITCIENKLNHVFNYQIAAKEKKCLKRIEKVSTSNKSSNPKTGLNGTITPALDAISIPLDIVACFL